MDYMNTSPQMMLTLLRQLVNEVGVSQADIAIGDTLCYFPNQYYDICHDEFPHVRYLDYEGKFGRIGVQQSSLPLYWSCHPSVSCQDYVPVSYVQADYIINMANFKSHSMAAVTLCGKNHYGSLVRWPSQSEYYDLHGDLPSERGGMGYYRNIVDLMGHAHIGGKTLLYFIDGLYAGHHPYDDAPTKLNSAPFNGDWSSSIFVSQDPISIDSVAFDILWSEPGWEVDTHISGGDDYLHEAAQADNPPSGTFYDPDHSGDVIRLTSLGVHEHWNNPTEKQYSRNLGTGDGIELIYISSDTDNDGILDDGDNNGTPGDNPCTGGVTENCDDNCPDTANGPDGGTCIAGNVGSTCKSNGDCGTSGFCSMGQEDADGDGVGDICDTDNPVVSVFLKPNNGIVPVGGSLGFQATVINNTEEVKTVYFATDVRLPNGTLYPPSGYLFGPIAVTLYHHQSLSGHITQYIPSSAPLGTYIYYGYVYLPGVGFVDEDQFDFTVTATTEAEGAEDWEAEVDEAFSFITRKYYVPTLEKNARVLK
jgi:hypothetical protein